MLNEEQGWVGAGNGRIPSTRGRNRTARDACRFPVSAISKGMLVGEMSLVERCRTRFVLLLD